MRSAWSAWSAWPARARPKTRVVGSVAVAVAMAAAATVAAAMPARGLSPGCGRDDSDGRSRSRGRGRRKGFERWCPRALPTRPMTPAGARSGVACRGLTATAGYEVRARVAGWWLGGGSLRTLTWPALDLARLARTPGRGVDDQGRQAARAGARLGARPSRPAYGGTTGTWLAVAQQGNIFVWIEW